MTQDVRHRGPDGSGQWGFANVQLGHRRLAILDVSERGRQPMPRGSLVITYNGEIYNYIELREELVQEGLEFHTGTDTEVILAAYAHWGPKCVERFDGMWAFAIFDTKSNQLFCSRDRFGEKPFHLKATKNYFAFGSEIKQLHRLSRRRVANRRVLANYLVLGLEGFSDESFFDGITTLLPGTNLTLDCVTGVSTLSTYYRPGVDAPFDRGDLEDANTLLTEELTRSIGRRLRSDVKVGSCLSGGIDSSLIATIAAKSYTSTTGEPFYSFTLVSGDRANDEEEYAAQVALSSKLAWHRVLPSTGDPKSLMSEVMAVHDVPVGGPSVAMQYLVMKAASEAGCTVLLDGQGADECWLGYPRYLIPALREMPLRKRLRGFALAADNSGLGIKRAALYYAYFSGPSLARTRNRMRWGFLNSELLQESLAAGLLHSRGANRGMAELQVSELTKYQLPPLLRIEDANAMHFSVETRLPFLDHRLVELALAMPTAFKIHNGWSKYPLRRMLAANAPPAVAWRKRKIGFEAPRAAWMEGDPRVERVISESELLGSLTRRPAQLEYLSGAAKWRLYSVAEWAKLHNVE